MIEIIVRCNGREDRAEADCEEAALLAARTLFREAYESWSGGFVPTVSFEVAGEAVAPSAARRCFR